MAAVMYAGADQESRDRTNMAIGVEILEDQQDARFHRDYGTRELVLLDPLEKEWKK